MVVFAFVLAIFHNHNGVGVITQSWGAKVTPSTFLVAFMAMISSRARSSAGINARSMRVSVP